MVLCASDALEVNEQRLNELNVFPVPDGDTGTNMSLTMAAAAQDMRRNHVSTIEQASGRVASAQLRGARGNSGVIMSLLFRGIAKGLKGLETAGAAEFACAMSDGVEAAYKAVMKPAEGTILTVSRLAAEAAVSYAQNTEDACIEDMFAAAIEAGKEALADTMNINPVLKKAGVVDAGGQGYIFILEAMLGFLTGEVTVSEGGARTGAREKADFTAFNTEDIKYGYCTEFIIRKQSDKNPDLLRAYLGTLGDCVVVVDDEEIIKTHAHVNDPGKALTEALTYGPVLTVKVENMREQHSSMGTELEAAAEDPGEIPEPVPAEKAIGVVAVCAGSGIEDLFRTLGADNLVTGGQTMNPSTEDILRAVNLTPAETVFVFPNNKNIIMAAEQCIPLTDRRIIVIPSKTIPQGVCALMRYDPEGDAEALEAEFTDALGTVHTAQITYAARNSDFDGHDIKAGEFLALLDGQLIDSFRSAPSMLKKLAKAFNPLHPEFINIYYGENVPEEDAKAACDTLAASFPDAELNLIYGGQPVYYYIISVE